jgi:hypothetical protein
VTGEALRPPSPAHLRASWTAAGEVKATWVRRSRSGWAWLDGLDAPLGESVERYRIRVGSRRIGRSGNDSGRSSDSGRAACTAWRGPFNLSVVQVGDFAESRPAIVIVN